jgi:hypothetical protein
MSAFHTLCQHLVLQSVLRKGANFLILYFKGPFANAFWDFFFFFLFKQLKSQHIKHPQNT